MPIHIERTVGSDQRNGEVVLATCFQPSEHPGTMGKLRPMVLWSREDGHYWAMGLTTNPTYQNGSPRVPIPDPAALGLVRQGFLWSCRLTRISVVDVIAHIGWATPEVLELIHSQIRFPAKEAAWPIWL